MRTRTGLQRLLKILQTKCFSKNSRHFSRIIDKNKQCRRCRIYINLPLLHLSKNLKLHRVLLILARINLCLIILHLFNRSKWKQAYVQRSTECRSDLTVPYCKRNKFRINNRKLNFCLRKDS